MKASFTILLTLLAMAFASATVVAQSDQKAELAVQVGHSASVRSIAFSPDGKYLISGSHDQTVKIWDAASGIELRTLTGHEASVKKVAVSPDGQTLASAGTSDGTIRLWKLDTGQPLMVLKGDTTFNLSKEELRFFTPDYYESVTDLAFSPDGKLLASCNYKAIKLWDAQTGKLLNTLIKHTDWIYSIAFRADGKQLMSAGRDGTVRIWDPLTGQLLNTLTDQSAGSEEPPIIESVSFLNDDAGVSGDNDGKIKIWGIKAGRKTREFDSEGDLLKSVTVLPGGTMIVSGGLRGIKIWNLATGTARTLTQSGAEATAYSSSTKILASSGEDKTIRFWDLESGQQTNELKGRTARISSLSLAHTSPFLAVGFNDSIVKLWDLERGESISLNAQSDRPAKLTLLSGIYDYNYGGGSTLVSFSPDDEVVVTGNRDIKIWEVRSGKLLHSMPTEDISVNTFAFSPSGRQLASNSLPSPVVKLWDVKSGQWLRDFSDHRNPVDAIAFSPNGDLLATGSRDHTVKLWNVQTGKVIKTLEAHDDYVGRVDFSTDGQKLVSADIKGAFKVWSVENFQLIESLSPADPDFKQKLSQISSQLKFEDASINDEKFRFRAGGQGSVNIFDRASRKLRATLLRVDNDWAVITPQGLFDASPGARKRIHYVVGLEPVSLEQMKELYYVPHLLSLILTGETLEPASLFSSKDLFPLAEYDPLKPDQTSFNLKLINRGGGIGPVQLFINNKECGSESGIDARPPDFDPNQASLTLPINLAKCGLLIAGRENKVEVVAYNQATTLNSTGSSRGVGFTSLVSSGVKAAPPHFYAIVAGISNYARADLKLDFAASDAEEFAKALEIGAVKLFGADKVHIRLLTSNQGKVDLPSAGSDTKTTKATKADFNRAFDEFKRATPNDVFIVYLAGHGVAANLTRTTSQIGGDTYLYLTQEAYTKDKEALAEAATQKKMTISSDELAELMKENKALKQVLILDTCEAGAASRSLIASRVTARDVTSDRLKAIDRLQRRIGFFVLLGAPADKNAYEQPAFGHGLLTYALLEGLKGQGLRIHKFADVDTLFNFALDRVPELARTSGRSQYPLMISPPPSIAFTQSGSFDIGMFTTVEQSLITINTPKPLLLNPILINHDKNYDDLGLTALLADGLHEACAGSDRGPIEVALAWADANEMKGGVKPIGSYVVAGDIIIVTLKLVRDNAPIGSDVSARGKISEKDQLVKQLVASIMQFEVPK